MLSTETARKHAIGTRAGTLLIMLALITAVTALCFGILSGCSSAAASKSTTNPTAPPLMPASHLNRFEDGSATRCSICHALNKKGEPSLKDAPLTPDSHYIDNNPTQGLSPDRLQCNTCHSVTPR